jgi:alkylated DNA repair dioxygenase AlkB
MQLEMKAASPMNQSSLFPISILPDGFVYRSGFLSATDEAELLSHIRELDFAPFDFRGYKALRRVVQYGRSYDFNTRQTSAERPLPEYLLSTRDRAADFAGVAGDSIVQATIAEYSPGAPIGWHRDVPEFEVVIGVSLLGMCRMRLKKSKAEGKILSIDLEPRSIYLLSGEARWAFQHSIPPVKEPRYSITFRTARKNTVER